MYSRAHPGQSSARLDDIATAASPVVDSPARLPFLTKLVLLSLLTPAYFSLGSLSLSPSKVLFLAIVPLLTVNLFRGLYGRLFLSDILVYAYAAWMTLAMLANHTPRVAIEYTGSNTVILLGGYLTARATIRTKAEFVALIRFLAFVVVLSLPFALYETVTSRTTIPRWLAEIPGIRSHSDINHDPRFGLWRAQFVFAHPIHYGLFCSMAFSLVFVGLVDIFGRLRRFVVSGIIGLCCFLSVSSGPVLALLSQVGLIGWGGSMRWTGFRWRLFGVLATLTYIVVELASTRPGIYAVVSRLSFSGSTAFARRVLFEYGVAQIGRAPILGVGYNPWPLPRWMSGSIDNFWLFLAVTFGVPTFVFCAGAFLAAMILIGRRNFDAAPDLLPLRRAWIFTMISLSLTLATVAIWGEIYSLVLFMLGSGMWMATVDGSSPGRQPARPVAKIQGRVSRFTRFPVRERLGQTRPAGADK